MRIQDFCNMDKFEDIMLSESVSHKTIKKKKPKRLEIDLP